MVTVIKKAILVLDYNEKVAAICDAICIKNHHSLHPKYWCNCIICKQIFEQIKMKKYVQLWTIMVNNKYK